MIKVLDEVAAERERQEAKWGQQNHHDGTGPLTLFLGARVPEEHTYADIRERATDLTNWNSNSDRLSYADIYVLWNRIASMLRRRTDTSYTTRGPLNGLEI